MKKIFATIICAIAFGLTSCCYYHDPCDYEYGRYEYTYTYGNGCGGGQSSSATNNTNCPTCHSASRGYKGDVIDCWYASGTWWVKVLRPCGHYFETSVSRKYAIGEHYII